MQELRGLPTVNMMDLSIGELCNQICLPKEMVDCRMDSEKIVQLQQVRRSIWNKIGSNEL